MRTKKALLAYMTDIIPMAIIMLLGLIKINFFIEFLGKENNGLYNLYSQIMAYLTIVDGGLTSAVLYRLYAPIAEGDNVRLGSILSGSKKIFNIIGGVILFLGVCVSFFIPLFVKDNTFEFSYLQFTFILYLLGSVVPYFYVISKIIIEAHQEKYISNIVFQSIAIVKAVFEIVVLLLGGGLYIIIGLYALSNVISSVIIYRISKSRYPNIELSAVEPSYEILSDVKDLMIHKIATLVAYNLDTIIISVCKGLSYVTVYVSYNYLVTNIANVVGKISGSVLAGVGEVLQGSKEKAYDVFSEFNALVFFIAISICVPLLVVINPFIDIWLGGKVESTFLLALSFCLNLFYDIIRMPLNTFIVSAGLFRETRIFPVMEIVVNLGLSLILLKYLGIAGVLLATFAAHLVADYFVKPRIIYMKKFEKSCMGYYVKNVFFAVIAVLNYLICVYVFQVLPGVKDNYFIWFVYSCIVFCVNFVLTGCEFYFSGNMLFGHRVMQFVKIKNR